MIHRILILVLLTVSKFTVSNDANIFAQSEADTLIAEEYYQKGNALLTSARYDSSIFYFQKASSVFRKWKVWRRYFHSKHKIAENYRRLSHFDKGLEEAEQTLNESIDILGEGNLEEAEAFTNLGIFYDFKGQYDTALTFHERAVSIRKKLLGEDHRQVAVSYNNMGIIYDLKGHYDKAIEYHKKALAIRKLKLPENHLHIASSYHNLGVVYNLKGNDELALEYYQKAFEIRETSLGEKHPLVSDSYVSLGLIYSDQGNYNLALEFFERSLLIRKEVFGSKHLKISQSYTNMGVVHLELKNYDIALRYFQKARDVALDLFGPNHNLIGARYGNLGRAYQQKGVYDSALNSYVKAARILEGHQEEANIAKAILSESLGDLYSLTQDYTKALRYYKHALEYNQQLFGTLHPASAKLYISIGDIFERQGEINKSLTSYQKAIVSNVIGFDDLNYPSNPKIQDNVLNNQALLTALQRKALSLERLEKNASDSNDQLLALSTLELCDSLILKMRRGSLRYKDKVNMSKITKSIYEQSVRVSFNLYEVTGNNEYAQKAFLFSEKSKSNLLKGAISRSLIKDFGLIPDDILKLERILKSDISYYQSRINDIESGTDEYDNSLFITWKGKLFQANRKYDSLQQILIEHYPIYHNLSYGSELLDISSIQNKLEVDEVLIEYFLGDSYLYTFLVDHENFRVHTARIDSTFNKELYSFTTFLEKRTSGTDELIPFLSYVSAAHSLYKKLLGPLEEYSNAQKIKIIPDGKLGYIPYEVLLTQGVDIDMIDYRDLSYLVNDFEISYSYSATLLSHKYDRKKDMDLKFISFAPDYQYVSKDSSKMSTFDQFRDEVGPLKWNQKEALQIAQFMEGEIHNGTAATESEFKDKVNNFDVIHLAMHAFVDDNDPMNSKLVFAPGNDSIEDGALHAFELYNMELNAELAVLSACKTGYGRLAEGEGVMSLAMAFSYAGVPSVVMSHWQVDDQSTSELMELFFQNLSKGMRKSEALRSAKLEFLGSTSSRRTHPYYWATFVVVGDDSALQFKSYVKSSYFLVFSTVLVLIGVVYLVVRNRKNGFLM